MLPLVVVDPRDPRTSSTSANAKRRLADRLGSHKMLKNVDNPSKSDGLHRPVHLALAYGTGTASVDLCPNRARIRKPYLNRNKSPPSEAPP